MKIIALVSQKGGSGKTTLAVHLCVEAEADGMRPLLLDLDPQASAALWGDLRGDHGPDVATEHPARLEQALKAARERGYDLVVLDTAPHADQAALKAAKLADMVLVPCRPARFDLGAITATRELVQLAGKDALVVLNAVPTHSPRMVDAARSEITGTGFTVAAPMVRQLIAFQHCLNAGQVAREFEPGGAAAAEIADLWRHVRMKT